MTLINPRVTFVEKYVGAMMCGLQEFAGHRPGYDYMDIWTEKREDTVLMRVTKSVAVDDERRDSLETNLMPAAAWNPMTNDSMRQMFELCRLPQREMQQAACVKAPNGRIFLTGLENGKIKFQLHQLDYELSSPESRVPETPEGIQLIDSYFYMAAEIFDRQAGLRKRTLYAEVCKSPVFQEFMGQQLGSVGWQAVPHEDVEQFGPDHPKVTARRPKAFVPGEKGRPFFTPVTT